MVSERNSSNEVGNPDILENAIGALIDLPQEHAPVAHQFGPLDPETGTRLYIRTVTLLKDTVAIGHRHLKPCFNRMISGSIAAVDDGKLVHMIAPMEFQGKIGDQKAGIVLDTVIWESVWIVKADNVVDAESEIFDLSHAIVEKRERIRLVASNIARRDREDFDALIKEYGLDRDIVRFQSESVSDQIDMPHDYLMFTVVRPSPIEGEGLFLSWPVKAGCVVAPARIGGKRTPAGRYVNHSAVPNCEWRKSPNGDIWLVAKRDIDGCHGGTYGEELTVDYRESLALHGIKKRELA